MLGISLIHIKSDLKRVIYLPLAIVLYHGDQWNKTMVAISSNHLELPAIHEASPECIWLRSMIQHIWETCGLSSIKNNPTILYEDTTSCIAQIKGDRTNHISPRFFYTHELQKNCEIDIQ